MTTKYRIKEVKYPGRSKFYVQYRNWKATFGFWFYRKTYQGYETIVPEIFETEREAKDWIDRQIAYDIATTPISVSYKPYP